MMFLKILVCMLFLHVVDDYYLQGQLSDMKQKKWWEELFYGKFWDGQYDKYKYDYLAALFAHSFSWTFVTHIPWIFNPNLGSAFAVLFIANIFFHAYIDDLKCNDKSINLIQDQLAHCAQIIISCTIYYCLYGGL